MSDKSEKAKRIARQYEGRLLDAIEMAYLYGFEDGRNDAYEKAEAVIAARMKEEEEL